MVEGSPGPLDRKTPSGLTAIISAADESNGMTCTSTPRSASAHGVAPLIPRSSAATVNFFLPTAGITTTCGVETSRTKYAPVIASALRTSTTISSRESSNPEKIPTRIDPRSRRCRVIARVSTP